ncbi:MAG: hypothetical protein GX663_09125 [Clostridiales bacterium]|nr:hypothetical protein [Clostridiales bacterium]
MKVEQFVMAYKVEQDKIRAMLPAGFQSLRPVLRINAEICGEEAYIELNTPVAAFGKQGWLNIDNWKSPETNITYSKNGQTVTFATSFLEISYTGVGIEGGCPAERDNDGCFFIKKNIILVLPEKIYSNKEFCDCKFAWNFINGDAHGVSIGGKTFSAIANKPIIVYEKQELTAKAAAHIKCEQMLGQYKVVFER